MNAPRPPRVAEGGWRLPPDVRRPLLSARLWSVAFQVASKVSLLGATFLAAGLLGVRDFGVLAALQGTAVLSGSVADVGTSMLVQREVAAGRASSSLLAAAIRLRLRVVAPLAGLAVGGTVAWTHDISVSALVGIFAVAALAMNCSALTDGLLQGQLRFRASALSQSAGRLGFFVAVAVLWLCSVHSLVATSLAFALGEVLIGILQACSLAGRLHLAPGGSMRMWREVRHALPYWINSVFNLVYNRADAAVVALLAGATQAGLYAPASSIQNALMVVPSLAITGLPNVGARVFSQGRPDIVLSMFRRALVGGTVLGLACAIAVTALGIPVTHLLGRSAFQGSVTPVVILAWSLPFYAAEHAILGYLVAVGRPRATTLGYGAALITALLGMAVLAPAHGAVGASVASLLREPVATIVLAVVAVKGRTTKGVAG
jgi:O-antigen/teichoic acid export membrane protein